MKVRNLAKIVLCVCLTGGHALRADPRVVGTGQAVPRPESSAATRPGAPADSRGQVLYLELSGGHLSEGVAPSAVPVPLPKIVVLTERSNPTPAPVARPAPPNPTPAPAARPVPPYQPQAPAARPVSPNPNEVPALRREIALQLTHEIDGLRAKLQVLNAQAMARATPPQLAAPRPVETPAVQQVGFTERSVPVDSPTASQREINRLLTHCISDLEQEVRDLSDRVRAMTPPGR